MLIFSICMIIRVPHNIAARKRIIFYAYIYAYIFCMHKTDRRPYIQSTLYPTMPSFSIVKNYLQLLASIFANILDIFYEICEIFHKMLIQNRKYFQRNTALILTVLSFHWLRSGIILFPLSFCLLDIILTSILILWLFLTIKIKWPPFF